MYAELLRLPIHIRSDIYSNSNSYWRFYVQDASVLDGRLIQSVVLPDDDDDDDDDDDRLVRLQTRTRR